MEIKTIIKSAMREAELEGYKKTVAHVLFWMLDEGFSKEEALDRALSNSNWGWRAIAEIKEMVDEALSIKGVAL